MGEFGSKSETDFIVESGKRKLSFFGKYFAARVSAFVFTF